MYFEEATISITLDALRQTLRHPYKAPVLDDVDKDPTATVVRDGSARWPEAELLKNDQGRGVLGGTSKFSFRKWLLDYIRWYLHCLTRAPLGIRRKPR